MSKIYYYLGILDKKIVCNYIYAASYTEAENFLRACKIEIIRLQRKFFISLNVSNKDLIDLCTSIKLFYKSTNNILLGIKKAQEISTNKYFIAVLERIIYEVKNGHTLSYCIQKIPNIFDKVFVYFIKIGEQNDFLLCIQSLIEYLSCKEKYYYSLFKTFSYPFVVFSCIFSAIVFTKKYLLEDLYKFSEKKSAILLDGVFYFMLCTYFVLFPCIFSTKYRKKILNLLPFVKDIDMLVEKVNLIHIVYILLKNKKSIIDALHFSCELLHSEQRKKEIHESILCIKNNKKIPYIYINEIFNLSKNEKEIKSLYEFYSFQLFYLISNLHFRVQPLLMIFLSVFLLILAYTITFSININYE